MINGIYTDDVLDSSSVVSPDPTLEEDSGTSVPEDTSGSSSEIAEDISEDLDVPEEASEVIILPFYEPEILDEFTEDSSNDVQVDVSSDMIQQLNVTNSLLIIIVVLLLIKLLGNIMATLFKS